METIKVFLLRLVILIDVLVHHDEEIIILGYFGEIIILGHHE